MTLVADWIRIGEQLLIDGAHVDGQGLTVKRIRELAQALGQVEDVKEVVVQEVVAPQALALEVFQHRFALR